jgi:hypothetical protein
MPGSTKRSDGTGQWISEERNLYEAFEQAFGEEPGKLTDVGSYTNADLRSSQSPSWCPRPVARHAPPGTIEKLRTISESRFAYARAEG